MILLIGLQPKVPAEYDSPGLQPKVPLHHHRSITARTTHPYLPLSPRKKFYRPFMASKRKAPTSSTSDSECGGKAKKASTSSSASSEQDSTSASSSSAKGAGRYFLMKSEPHEFSIDDLGARPNQESWWEGVRNYQARNIMRDQMKVGDLAFFYHSSCKVPGIVGIMEISKEAYPDHFQFDKLSKYYDAGSKKEEPRWMMVDVRLKEKFPEILPLEMLREHSDGALKDMLLLKKGSRLSVQPVSQEEWDYIQRLLKEKNANSTSQ